MFKLKGRGTSCLLSWMDNVPGTGTNFSTSFIVEYSEDYIVLIWARSSSVTDMPCVINGLDPFIDYVFHVIGINSFGESAPSYLIALEGKCYIFFSITHVYIHNYKYNIDSHSSSLYV